MALTEELPAGAETPPRYLEIGSTGLRRSGGLIIEEYLPELRGNLALQTYRRMESDPVVGGLLFALECMIRRVEWHVEAADESPEAVEMQQFAEELMSDMEHSWSDMLGEISTMFAYGFAPMELVYKQRRGPDKKDPRYQSKYTDSRIGWRKISLRAQHTVDRWVFENDTGEVVGFYQNRNETGLPQIFIPADRYLLFRTKAVSNNPAGRSILRPAYKAWWLRSRIEQIEVTGVERDLAGLPIYRIPSDILAASDAKMAKAKQDAQEMVSRVRRDEQEGLLLPSDRDEKGNLHYEFELLSSGGTRQLDTSKIIERYDNRILMSCLADFMTLGQGSTGSYALSSDKTEMFTVALRTYLTGIEDTLNRFALPVLWALNALDPDVMPKFKAGEIEPPDLTALGSFVGALTGAGMQLFPDRVLEDDLRAKGGLPPVPEDRDDEALARQAAGVPPENDPQFAGLFGDTEAEEQRVQEAHDSNMADAEAKREHIAADAELKLRQAKAPLPKPGAVKKDADDLMARLGAEARKRNGHA